MNSGNKRAFTLIELMVVIVLIAALMLIALPAFQGADRGNRLRTATFQFYTTVNLVRQTAITKRMLAHIVIPDNGPSLYSGIYSNQKDKAFHAYAPYSTKDGYMGEWKYLPPGVLFNAAFNAGRSSNVFTLAISSHTNFMRSIPFPTSTDPAKSILTVAFRPDGVLHGSNIREIGVYFSEGTLDANLIPAYRPNAPVLCLDVHNITGRVRSREYYAAP